MFDFNIVEFIGSLTLLQVSVFLMGVELIEVITGMLHAWKRGEKIKSSFTREMIVSKFDSWRWILGFTMFALFIGQPEVAKLLLMFIAIPELTSIVENIVRSVKKIES